MLETAIIIVVPGVSPSPRNRQTTISIVVWSVFEKHKKRKRHCRTKRNRRKVRRTRQGSRRRRR